MSMSVCKSKCVSACVRAHNESLTAWLSIPITFVRRCIQKHEGKHIEVPHAINASKECTVDLNCVSAPLPVSFIHLPTQNKPKTALLDISSTIANLFSAETFILAIRKRNVPTMKYFVERTGHLYLAYDEENDSHGSACQGDQHQEFKTEDQALN